jgi:hypothetical protein
MAFFAGHRGPSARSERHRDRDAYWLEVPLSACQRLLRRPEQHLSGAIMRPRGQFIHLAGFIQLENSLNCGMIPMRGPQPFEYESFAADIFVTVLSGCASVSIYYIYVCRSRATACRTLAIPASRWKVVIMKTRCLQTSLRTPSCNTILRFALPA